MPKSQYNWIMTQEGFTTYSSSARKQLFDGKEVSPILDFDSPNKDGADNEAYLKNVGRISLSGVQPKASLVINDDNKLVKPAENERGTFILKPAPSSYALQERKYCPANEHLTMQLASQVYHIETAVNALCFFRDGEAAYLCRRFDVGPNGQKYSQEDFASLAGLTNANGGSNFKYSNLSYEDCADIIRKYVKAGIARWLSIFAGPIGWMLTAIWTAIDIVGPAYRVTIPCVIQIAYMRIKTTYKSNNPQL